MAWYTTPVVALALAASPLTAQENKDQLLLNVERELPLYVRGVDASTLTRSQLATVYNIMHGPRGEGEKRNLIKSTIEGPNLLMRLFKRL